MSIAACRRFVAIPKLSQSALIGALCACAALACATTTARAQSLQALFEAAQTYDASFLAAKAQADSVRFKAAQSDSLLRPSVGLTAGYTHTQIDPPDSGRSGSGDRVSTNKAELGVQATQPLYNPANKASVKQARRGFEIARAELEAAEQDLIVRVAQVYFDVLAAQDALGTAQTNQKAIKEQLASAKRNFEVGTATITDTREAQARFDLALAQTILADNELRTKQVALDTVVGQTNLKPQRLAASAQLPAVTPEKMDIWTDWALAQNPGIRKAQLALDVAKFEIDKARAASGPTLDLNGSLGANNLSGSGASPSGTTTAASLGLQLKMPLYAGGSLQNRVKETLALEEKSRNELEAARRGVTQTVRQVFMGTQSLLAQVKAFEAAESSSKLALDATQLGYKVGVRVNLDVLNAQTQLFTTRRDLAKARYEVLLAQLKLRQASGRLTPADLTEVSRLLAAS
jgi:outer membrane protein